MVKRFMLQRPIKRMVSSILVCSFLIGVTLWMLLPEWPGWPTRWMEAVADTIDEAQMQDVNDKTDVTYSILKYDRRTGNMSLNAVITNTSSESLPKPMYLVVDSITSGQVQLLQSHGNTASGKPYFDVSALITGSVLAPGASTRALTFELHNPNRVRFDLNLTVYISGIPAPNNAPVITSSPVTTGEEGVAYSYDVDATDADGDSLTYALTVSPPGMSIDPVTGIIAWTPSAAQVGSHDVTVQVTDGRGGENLQSFTVTVQVSNDPPTADPGGPYTAKVGQMIMFDGSGSTDPDNDILECTWDFGDGTTSKGVKLSHTYDSAGDFTVMLTVEDGHGGTDTASTTATLVEVILNVSITEPVDGAVTNTTPVVVHGTVSDPDSRVMVQNVIASVSETTFQAEGVALSEGPNELYAQAHNDAGSQATAMHRVVLDTTPPVIAILSPPERSVSTLETVEILAVVDDATDVTCLIDGAPATMEDDLFKGTVTLVEGENIVTVTAEDASGNTSSESLTLYLDTELLFVIGVEPADGAIDVDPNVSVTVSYSEAVDPLSVHAASLYLRADSMLLWADITTSGDGLTSTLAPTLPLPSGTAIDIIATSGITDLAGNPLQGPFMSQFTTSGDVVWSGVALGEVYDDTRSLPLEAATVEAFSIDTGQILDTTQTDDRGRYLIKPGQAPALIRVSKPEFTTVERLLAVPEGEYAEILDARLTPLSDPQMVDAILGAELHDPLGDQLTIPPGALAEDAAVMFTPISQQGPRNLFPPGWIPLGIVEIHGPEAFQVPASLILVDRSGAASEKQAVIARYDGSSGKWTAVANVSVTAEGVAQVDQLTEPGQYALLLPDEGNGAPDLAIPGEPLPEGTEEPIPDDAAASGVVEPPTGRADDPTPALATVTITSETPLRSGTPILGDFMELFILRDGERISPLDTSQDFLAYRSPADIEGKTLALSFPIAPSRVFNLAEILEGTITVVLSRHAIVERDVIGNTGGGIQTEDGIRLIIPPSVLGCDIPVNVRRIDTDAISVDVPEEWAFIGGFELDLSGRTSSESLIVSIEDVGAFVRTGSQVIVAELRYVQGRDRLVFVALARIDGDAVTTVTQVDGLTLPGIRKGGRYLFYRFDGELEVVAGTARDETGRRDGHLVELEGFPFVSVTNASGFFAVPSPPGLFTLIATGAVIHDRVRVEWNTGVPLPEIVIVPTPPMVERITVRPPKIEGNFAGPVVLLGKPKPVIDDDIEGGSSGNGDGQIDAGERIELSLAVRNDGTVAVPGGYFVLSVLTTGGALDVTPSSTHVELLPPDEPVIVGPFVFEVPADTGPAELRYRLAYFTDTALSREHLFQLPLDVDHPNVSVHSEITVYFSEPVTAQVLQTAVILEKESDTGLLPVSTKVLTNEDSTAFIVRPLETLTDDAIYQVRLADTIVDLDGRQLVDGILVERFSTEDLTPPGPIEPGKIEASVPDENGMVNITGSLGSVNPDDIVIVLNETTGFTAFAEPNPDGSFSASVQAEITDQITIIVRDRSDNEIRIPVDTLIRRDPITGEIISVVLGRAGGTFTNADGIGLTVPEGALLGPTELSVSRVDEPFTLPPDIASDPDLVTAFESHFSVVDRIRIDASTHSFAQPVRLSLPPPAGSTPDDLFLIVRPREVTVGGVLVDLDKITGLTAVENPIRTVERLEVLDTATVKEMDGEMVLSTDSPPFPGITEPGDVTLLLVEVADTKMFFAGEVRRDTATGRRVSGAVVQGLPTAEETSAFAAVTDRNGQFVVLSALTEGPFPQGSVVLSRLDVRDPSFERVVRRDVRGTVSSPSPPNTPVAHLVEPFVLPAVLPPEIVDVLGDIEPPEVAIHVNGPSFSDGISFVGEPLNITVYAQDNDEVEFVSLMVDQGSGFDLIPLSENDTATLIPSIETLVTLRGQAQDRSKNVTFADRYVRIIAFDTVFPEPLPDQPPVPVKEPGKIPPKDDGVIPPEEESDEEETSEPDKQLQMFSNREVLFDGDITLIFSEPLDPATVDSDSVRLFDPEGKPVQVEITLERNDTLIRITPRRNLRLGAVYMVEITSAIRDLNGDSFAGGTYNVQTRPPEQIGSDADQPTIYLQNVEDVSLVGDVLAAINHPDGVSVGDNGEIRTYQVWDDRDIFQLLSEPRLLGSSPVNGRPLSISVDGNRVFVGNRFLGPIATKDISFAPYFPLMNPEFSPDVLLMLDPISLLSGGPMYYGMYLYWKDLPTPASNLEAFNLSNSANPERTGGKAINYVPYTDLWNPNTWPTRVEVANQGVAVLNFIENIEFFSPDPAPERLGLVGRVREYGEAKTETEFWDAVFFNGFAAALVTEGVSIVSTSPLNLPLEQNPTIGSISLGGTAGGRIGGLSGFEWIDSSGSSHISDLAFIAQRGYGLTILDVTRPTSPSILGTLPGAFGNMSLDRFRGVAYLHGWDGQFHVVDFKDPTDPIELNNPGANKAPFRVRGLGSGLSSNGNANRDGVVYLASRLGVTIVSIDTKRCRETCIDTGSLGGGNVSVSNENPGLDETITFTAFGVTDSGGKKKVGCSDGTVFEEVIPPATIDYKYELQTPSGSITGTGNQAMVVTDEEGLYICSFTASVDRDCPPEPLDVGEARAAASCKVLAVEVYDSDNRKAISGLLEVVPPLAGENIRLEATIDPIVDDEDYPEWQISSSFGRSTLIGKSASFEATNIPSSLIWLFHFVPYNYTITTDCGKTATVKAYTNKKGEWKLSGTEIEDMIEFVLIIAGIATKIGSPVEPIIEPPKGSFSFENQWKEVIESNEVNYTWKFVADSTSELGIRLKFGTSLAGIPPVLAEAAIYVELIGAIGIHGSAGVNEEEQFEVAGGAHGSITLGVGGKAEVANGAIEITLGAESVLNATGEFIGQFKPPAVFLSVKVEATPLRVKYQTGVLWGTWTYTDYWDVWQNITLYDRKVQIVPPPGF